MRKTTYTPSKHLESLYRHLSWLISLLVLLLGSMKYCAQELPLPIGISNDKQRSRFLDLAECPADKEVSGLIKQHERIDFISTNSPMPMFTMKRPVTWNGTNYLVAYDAPTNGSYFLRSNMDTNNKHFKGIIYVFNSQTNLIGRTFPGVLAQETCAIDDNPTNHVKRALGLPLIINSDEPIFDP